jgi:glutamine synthetase adenylyltransferase
LAADGLLAPELAEGLLENYEFLRSIETALRLDTNRAATSLPREVGRREALARWLGFPTFDSFASEHLRRMVKTRQIFDKLPSLLEFRRCR